LFTNTALGILLLVLNYFIMSKKNRYKFRDRQTVESSSPEARAAAPAGSAGAMAAHAAEYRIISRDLIRLVLVNGIMLAAVLTVYFTNRTSGYLERFFSNLF
jgi:hypothetical protein